MSADIVYVNILITGDSETNNYGFKKCQMEKTLNNNIIDNASEYYSSCMRLVLPMNLSPKFIFYINEGLTQTNQNQGVYSFYVRWNTSYYFSYVTYTPNNNFTANPPSLNNGKQDFSSPYYFINNYTQLSSMFTTTIQNLINLINIDYPGSLPANNIYFIWNSVNEVFELVYSSEYTNSLFGLYTNIYVRDILSGFPFTFYNQSYYDPTVAAFQFQLSIQPLLSNLYGTISSVNYYYIRNDSKTIVSYVNCLNNVYIVSNSLGMEPEYFISDNTTTNYSLQNVIFSFRPDNDISVNNSTSTMVYTADYPKPTCINTKGGLNKVDVNVVWTDIHNNVFPIYLSPDTEFSIKLAFYKKSMFNNNTSNTNNPLVQSHITFRG